MRTSYTLYTLYLLIPLLAGVLASTMLHRQGMEKSTPTSGVLKAWQETLPSTPIDAVFRLPEFDGGLFEIQAGGKIFYGNRDGSLLLLGHLYEVETNTDLTQSRINALQQTLRHGKPE